MLNTRPAAATPAMTELTADEFEKFCALIYRSAGIRIPPTKRVMVSNRVRRRLRETNMASFSAYYAFLNSPGGAAEMPKFLDEITTNETYFDRDVHHFDWFGSTFLHEIGDAARLKRRPKSLRVWSAASSTGEELYSIALRIARVRAQFSGWNITLLGTDLSNNVLAAAKAGSYDERALRLVPSDQRQKWFDPDPAGGRWIIKEEIRSMAVWKRHNLMTPLREPLFDCVFIKNVLIYFDAESKRAVVRHLMSALAPGGYLVVGPTEGIMSMLDGLEKIKPWLYRRPPA